jgi:hypothetical protein
MRTATIPRDPPTSAAWSRGLLLAMSCVLARIEPVDAPTGRILVPAAVTVRTLVGPFLQPPPQPRGNCFSIAPAAPWGVVRVAPRSQLWWVAPRGPLGGTGPFGRIEWKVCNMHAENFEAIVQRLGLRTVEVQPYDQGRCLITDPRIPRDWLLERPCPHCFRAAEVEDLLRRYPERFRR